MNVTEADVAKVLSDWTGIPVTGISESESDASSHWKPRLKEHIIGQDEAVAARAKAVRRGRSGSQGPDPADRLLPLLRPDGRGKTELCRALSDGLRRRRGHHPARHVRIYGKALRSAASWLAPGYVGYEDGGQLTERVRRRPWSVVLFDEIEKAHEDVRSILLQIMDYGHLTDSAGRRVDLFQHRGWS